MVDLTTRYLGMELSSPLVPSASPLGRDLEMALRLEDAGAAALVMDSLFEERIEEEERRLERFVLEQDHGHAEAQGFHPIPTGYRSYQEAYLERLARLKERLSIPVVASLNGITPGGWVELGRDLEEAGADALELNHYYIAASAEEDAAAVEGRYLDLLAELKRHISIPIVMKLGSQFSAPVQMVRRLEEAGAAGVSLFNRFHVPDVDLQTLEVRPQLQLSTPGEALTRVRWVALLRPQVRFTLAVTGGFHRWEEAAKALLAGADVVHLCSVLLRKGPEALTVIRLGIEQWMEEQEYDSLEQIRGCICYPRAIDPASWLRANYIDSLESY